MCRFFDGEETCTRGVVGLIRPPDLSDLFEPSGRPCDDDDVSDLSDTTDSHTDDVIESDEGDSDMNTFDRAGIAGSTPIAMTSTTVSRPVECVPRPLGS